MKSVKSLKIFAMLALCLGLSLVPVGAQAQQDSQAPQTPAPSAQNPADSQPQAQTFAGKIVKMKGNLVLKDELSSTTYQFDNADQAKQYVGKNVKVTGTLDPATKMIHISDIKVVVTTPSY
jgi:hypothetical protein